MTELLKQIAKPCMYGAWTRLSLYMALAALGVLAPELQSMDAGVWADMGWPQKIAFWLKPLAAALMTWRAFLDQTMGQVKAETDYKDAPRAVVVDEDVA